MHLDASGWNIADYTMAVQLIACTHNPGRVCPCSLSALPNLTGIPGITAAYISGYEQPILLTPTVSGLGRFVIEREDRGTGKGYVWKFVMDSTGQVWYKELKKPYPGHHFNPASIINLGTLFGNINN